MPLPFVQNGQLSDRDFGTIFAAYYYSIGLLSGCAISVTGKSLSIPIQTIPISHSPTTVNSINVSTDITASHGFSSSPPLRGISSGELYNRKGKSSFFDKITSSSLGEQNLPTYLDLKTRANVETVLSIANVSLYNDYSDSVTDNDLDDYEYASLPKMKRGTSSLRNETKFTQVVSSSGEENYTSSSVLNSTSHQQQQQPQPSNASEPTTTTTTTSTNTEVSVRVTDFATTTTTTTLSYAAVHDDDDATTSPPSFLMTAAETKNTATVTAQNRLNETSSPLRESDQPQASTGLNASQPQDVEETTTDLELFSDLKETVAKAKVSNLSLSDNVTSSSISTTTTTITTAAAVSSGESLALIVYENDPKWYGNPDMFILDDYDVFKERGCVDFSCKNDF